MKIGDFLNERLKDIDLDLNAEIGICLNTCCGPQEHCYFDEMDIDSYNGSFVINIAVGSCREYSFKGSCKNRPVVELLLAELQNTGQFNILLTSNNPELRKIAQDFLEKNKKSN